jgi:hypothetical protein
MFLLSPFMISLLLLTSAPEAQIADARAAWLKIDGSSVSAAARTRKAGNLL